MKINKGLVIIFIFILIFGVVSFIDIVIKNRLQLQPEIIYVNNSVDSMKYFEDNGYNWILFYTKDRGYSIVLEKNENGVEVRKSIHGVLSIKEAAAELINSL